MAGQCCGCVAMTNPAHRVEITAVAMWLRGGAAAVAAWMRRTIPGATEDDARGLIATIRESPEFDAIEDAAKRVNAERN